MTHLSPPSTIAVYALTPQGIRQALRIARATGAHVFVPETADPAPAGATVIRFQHLKEQVAETFRGYPRHIFITATGIAVRCIAPLLQSKYADPAVLVVDQQARFVISLLSGHTGGANAFARDMAELLGAVPIITTATDTEGLPALDVLAAERGLTVAHAGAVKHVSAALLAGLPVGLYDPFNRLDLLGTPAAACFVPLTDDDRPKEPRPMNAGHPAVPPGAGEAPCRQSRSLPKEPEEIADTGAVRAGLQKMQRSAAHMPCVLVSEYVLQVPADHLLLHPKTLFAGIGCRRGATTAAVLDLLRTVLANAGLAPASSAGLASFTVKQDEPALREAAAILTLPLLFFPQNILAALPVTRISAKAEATFGLKGVCEPAALAAAMGCAQTGRQPPYTARLLIPKQTRDGVTMAVAQRIPSCIFNTLTG